MIQILHIFAKPIQVYHNSSSGTWFYKINVEKNQWSTNLGSVIKMEANIM